MAYTQSKQPGFILLSTGKVININAIAAIYNNCTVKLAGSGTADVTTEERNEIFDYLGLPVPKQ